MATLQNIRDFTRNTLQTDDTDLPDSLLDVFANEAATRIIGLRDDWPHMYTEGTLSMVASDGIYSLSSGSFSPTTFRTIESVWDDTPWGRSLVQVDYQEASAVWIGPVADVSSEPRYFSVYGGNLYLWPIPTATRTLRIGGYRDPVEMAAAGDSPDLPSQLHAAVQYSTAALAYAQQEDEQLSALWKQMADESATIAIRNLFMNRRHRPIVLYGRDRFYQMSYDEWVRRNV
jgi:hypothetical protein